MLGEEEVEEDKSRVVSGIARKRYLRSVSWTDRSPTQPSVSSNPRIQNPNRAGRSFLPPLSIARRSAEEWPNAGSDDLGIWPNNNPQTPRGPTSEVTKSQTDFQFKRDKLAFFDKECSRIADHIYLGSDSVARNREVLKQNKITHVLNCVGFVCPEYFKSDFAYKTLWLKDTPSEDITSVLYDVFDYFEDVREQKGRVFVHCCQGVSRSNSLVIAYLMWREGESFEGAFRFVKAARGVTNPNVGFACQLLQCQKRVHAVPASPDSTLRMYRIAPHSPYDPLHLVPKLVSEPSPRLLDSRGAFVVHVPSVIYVWSGNSCGAVMKSNAHAAAFQVIRYERAKGPIVSVDEGQEPPEFWRALVGGGDKQSSSSERRVVEEYDLDFELFYKAIAGGVVPPFSAASSVFESETCLPARENGWSRLRRKFSIGLVKEFISSSSCNASEETIADVELCGSPDSFECFPDRSPEFGSASKSPTLSPSTSDYASSFSFSPSSSNWSDLSGLSSQQPSPSGLDSVDSYRPIKSISFINNPTSHPPVEEFYDNDEHIDLGMQSACKDRIAFSIAERRGSNPPPRMLLPSVEESSPQVSRNLGRSWSFSICNNTDNDDDDEDDDEDEDEDEEIEFDRSEVEKGGEMTIKPTGLYEWPSMNRVERSHICELDSRSSYVFVAREMGSKRRVFNSLTFWLGRESLHEKQKYNSIAQDFLSRMDIPLDVPVQVVREGEEPEKFLNQLRSLALQEPEDKGHG